MFIKKLKVKLGEILVQVTTLSPEQIKEALIIQARAPNRVIGEILVEKGYTSKEDVDTALAIMQGYPYIQVASCKTEPKLFKKIPVDLMWKFTFIPLDMVMNELTIAMSSLTHKSAILEELKSYKVRVFISTHKEITEALGRYLWIK